MNNAMTCPTCQTTQRIVGQFQSGHVVVGHLLILDCAHAWELIRPRVRPQLGDTPDVLRC